MLDRVGCHAGPDLAGKTIAEAIKALQGLDIKTIQIMTQDPTSYKFLPPEPVLFKSTRGMDYVVHGPYWSSFFNPKCSNIMKQYLRNLGSHWVREDGQLLFVTHSSTAKGMSRAGMIMRMKQFLSSMGPYLGTSIKLLIENMPGSKAGMSPTIQDLYDLKKWGSPYVGYCIDTEHAYANGEDPSMIQSELYAGAEMIHLNAIPEYVSFGNHFDRHSYTRLRKSKGGTDWMKRLKSVVGKDVPVIMERRDLGIIKEDVEFYRGL